MDPDARVYLDAFQTDATPAYETATNALFLALKAEAGLFEAIDGLYLPGPSEQTMLLNAKSPGTYDLTKSGTVTFTPYVSYKGNGVNGQLATGYNPTTAGGAWTLNSAHIGMWVLTNLDQVTDVYAAGGLAGMSVRGADNNWYGNLNDAASAYSYGSYTGDFVVNRRRSTHREHLHNGGLIQDIIAASTSLANSQLIFLRGASSFSSEEFGPMRFGGGLTSIQISAYFAALVTWMQDAL